MARRLVSDLDQPLDPRLTSVFEAYVEQGMAAALASSFAEPRLREGDHIKLFLEDTKRALAEGTLEHHLIRWAEHQRQAEQRLIENPLDWEDVAAAQVRYAERQNEVRKLRPMSLNFGVLVLSNLQPDDRVTLSMGPHALEPQVASSVLTGKVLGRTDVQLNRAADWMRGVDLQVETEFRTRPELFASEPLAPGEQITLAGTAIPATYHIPDMDKGFLVAGQTPVLIQAGEQRPIRMHSQRFLGERALHLRQLVINDVTMFRGGAA